MLHFPSQVASQVWPAELSSGMEIKLGRFLHTVPIVKIGKFCKSPLGLLWVEKGPVNKLFRCDPEGLANRCGLCPCFEGSLLHIHEPTFWATSNAGRMHIYILFAVFGIEKLPIWLGVKMHWGLLSQVLSVCISSEALPFVCSCSGVAHKPPVYPAITVFQGRVTRVCSGEKWHSKLRDSHRLARW